MATIQNSTEPFSDRDSDSDDSDVQLLTSTQTVAPKDPYHYVSITFTLLGLATLMPWCFFITATDYWMYKFRNVTNPYSVLDPKGRTDLQTTFGSCLAIVSNIPAFIILLASVHMTKIPEIYRIGISQLIILFMFIVTAALVFVDSDKWQTGFFAFTMMSVVTINVAGAVFQSGVVGLASLFPENFMHSTVTGQALAGVFAAVAQIVSMFGNASPMAAALAYFLCAVGGLFVTFLFYCGIHRTEVYRFYVQRFFDEQFSPISSTSLEEVAFPMEPVSNLEIFKKIWPCAICIAMTFTVTIALFPGVVVLVVSNSTTFSHLTGRFFLPITCFLLFNIGDFCGRLASGFIPLTSSGPLTPALATFSSSLGSSHGRRDDLILLALSIVRLTIVPLIMLCNAHPRSHLPVIFGDQYFIAFITLLGLTNGFTFCSAMMLGPKLVPNAYQERCGTILTVFLGIGLTLGSLLSLPLVKLL